MLAYLARMLGGEGFMPHGHCYLWKPELVWLHFWSDLLIGLSYVAISLMLLYLVRRARGDIPFHGMFIAFGTFIVACGATHFMEVWTIWNPSYWLSAWVKVVTAVASVATALALPPLIPVALNLVREARVSEERRLELETAHSELRGLYSRLKEFDELKTRFFANVSHELRTPLALIQGPVERLLEGPLGTGQERELQVVARNARTLRSRVDDLLDVARLEAGKLEMHSAPVDLAGLVRVSADHFESLARERNIEYRLETPERLGVLVDAEKVQRVLLNLLSNAFKYAPSSGIVSCRMEVRAQSGDVVHARITVGDSGPGIPAELREQVFERFAQGDRPSTSLFGGTGLGLAISREFVEAHGGSLSVERASEGGALLVVDLPGLVRAPDSPSVPLAWADSGQDVPSLQASERHEVTGDVPDLVVAEDNADLREFLVRSLQGLYHVRAMADGNEALQAVLASPPDLILTDLMMPGLSGERLVQEVRRRPELDDVPILVLSAVADEASRIRLLREGVQDFLLKSFSVEELRARLHNHTTLKRTGDVLRRELTGTRSSLLEMASELAERKRAVESALERVQAAREVAERASRIKGDFLRLVSHELRTPLHTMNLHVQLLRRLNGQENGRRDQALDRLESAWRRLVELVDSLLEYTRIQNRADVLEPTPVELGEVLREVAAELAPRAEAKGLELGVPEDTSSVVVETDRRLVRIVLRNLVENAVKYTDHGRVTLQVGRRGSDVFATVRDTGIGVSPQDHVRIFEPFEQLEPVAHKTTEGVGLGLAIVREISDVLGGRIELQSTPGQGSSFTLLLPGL